MTGRIPMIWTQERLARLEVIYARYGSSRWHFINDEFPDLPKVTKEQVAFKAGRMGMTALTANGGGGDSVQAIRHASLAFAIAGANAGLRLQNVRNAR